MNLQLPQGEPQEVFEASKGFLKLSGKSHCWVDPWAISHGKGIPLINSCLNWSTDFSEPEPADPSWPYSLFQWEVLKSRLNYFLKALWSRRGEQGLPFAALCYS